MFKIFRSALFLALIQMLCISTNSFAAPTPSSAPFELGCNLAAPTNMHASNIQTNSFTLTWDAVAGAAGYLVIVTNTATGGVVFNGTTTGTSIAITGMDPATEYSCSSAAMCDANTSSGNVTTILVKTDFVVIDDIVVQFPPIPVPVKILGADVPIDNLECLAVRYAGHYEYFRILRNTINLRVGHVNQEFGANGFPAGWYFGAEDIPTNNNWIQTENVSVFNLSKSTQFVPSTPDFTFTLGRALGTGDLRVHYIPTQYTIWQMECPLKPEKEKVKGSYTNTSTLKSAETLTAAPVPFADQLQLNLSQTLTEAESEVQLMDANGRLVRRIFAGAGTSQLNLETSDLSPGMYWVRHRSADAVQTLKVIKTE